MRGVEYQPLEHADACGGRTAPRLLGTSPERVVEFTLHPGIAQISSESIIERATPTLGDLASRSMNQRGENTFSRRISVDDLRNEEPLHLSCYSPLVPLRA